MTWSEGRITKMLRAKHAGDVFVSGCKDGPTVGGLRVLDGWVMPKSWAHPQCVGYEIKVSRSDWLGDKKWPTYLPLCHQLYIVCPYKMLKKDEIPDPLGLIWAHEGEGLRLTTAKKAAIRDVVIPESLFRYVLMCRATIEENVPPEGPDKEAWESWLAGKLAASDLGPHVSKKIRDLQQSENHKLAFDKLAARHESLTKQHELVMKTLRDSGVFLHYCDDREIQTLKERLAGKAAPLKVKNQADYLQRISRMVSGVAEELNEMVKGTT